MIYRNSKQGKIILDILKRKNFHPSASYLYDLVKKEIPGISLATVYRNLEKLIALNKIWKFKTPDGSYKYDGNINNHYHIICKICGEIKDICINKSYIKCIKNEICENNFYDIEVELSFQGICSNCKNKTINIKETRK